MLHAQRCAVDLSVAHVPPNSPRCCKRLAPLAAAAGAVLLQCRLAELHGCAGPVFVEGVSAHEVVGGCDKLSVGVHTRNTAGSACQRLHLNPVETQTHLAGLVHFADTPVCVCARLLHVVALAPQRLNDRGLRERVSVGQERGHKESGGVERGRGVMCSSSSSSFVGLLIMWSLTLTVGSASGLNGPSLPMPPTADDSAPTAPPLPSPSMPPMLLWCCMRGVVMALLV